jgi:macrolide-specific efflux system membrane fusion protein
MPRRKWLVIAAVVVVLVGGGLGAWFATRPTTTTTIRLGAVTTGTIKQSVSSSGTIEPAQQENLNFAVSGQVTAVNVKVGQTVTSGQTLASVNSASLSASVAQAQAAVDSDAAKVDSDQTNDASSAQLSADQAAQTAAQNQLNSAQAALGEANLSSPIAGTVVAVNLTTGQQVAAGSGAATGSSSGSSAGSSGSSSGSTGASGSTGSTGGGSTLGAAGSTGTAASAGSSSSSSSSSSTAQIVVISTNTFLVNAAVDDTEVGQVKSGDEAQITPDGSTTPVYGTVTSVAMLASSSSTVPTYPVSISITGTPSGLHAGASASVTIIVKQLANVLVVPTSAIHQDNGHSVVYEMQNGKQVTRQITTGGTSGLDTQVVSGLTKGEQVVLPALPPGLTGSGGKLGGGKLGSGKLGSGGGLGGGGLGGGGFGGGAFGGGRAGG